MIKEFSAAIALLVVLATLTACGHDDGTANDTQTATSGSEFNDADVDFATDMTQHHAQALAMVDMTLGRTLDPPVQDLLEDVRAAQTSEIEKMVDWLIEWNQPVPETVRDHANAHGEGGMETEETADLEAARGSDFQRLWLAMMIEHHNRAIEMARTQQSEGVNQEAIELAASIESSQHEEIATMEELLDS